MSVAEHRPPSTDSPEETLTPGDYDGVDTTRAELSQTKAAEVYRGAKDLGSIVLVACCRPFEGKNPLPKLSPRQYEVLLKLAEGQEYDEIGASLGELSGGRLARSTIRTHIHRTYQRLGVKNKWDAVGFIPIDERRLRAYSLTELQDDPENEGVMIAVNKLSGQEAKVYQALLDGANPKQMAHEMKPATISESTARTHLNNIRAKLGITTTAELVRFGLGMRNLADYAHELQEITEAVAAVLQPSIDRYLALIADDLSFHPLERPSILRISKNSPAAGTLQELGYTNGPSGRFDNIELDLSAVLAYIFIDQNATRQVMLSDQTSMVAREIIKGEAAAFLYKRELAKRPPELASEHPLDHALRAEKKEAEVPPAQKVADALTETQTKIIVRLFFSYREIATQLHITESTVRSHIFGAKVRLQKLGYEIAKEEDIALIAVAAGMIEIDDMPHESLENLTLRETEILAVYYNKSRKNTAATLGISESMVKSHWQSIYQKTSTINRVQACLLAARAGLIPLPQLLS